MKYGAAIQAIDTCFSGPVWALSTVPYTLTRLYSGWPTSSSHSDVSRINTEQIKKIKMDKFIDIQHAKRFIYKKVKTRLDLTFHM